MANGPRRARRAPDAAEADLHPLPARQPSRRGGGEADDAARRRWRSSSAGRSRARTSDASRWRSRSPTSPAVRELLPLTSTSRRSRASTSARSDVALSGARRRGPYPWPAGSRQVASGHSAGLGVPRNRPHNNRPRSVTAPPI